MTIPAPKIKNWQQAAAWAKRIGISRVEGCRRAQISESTFTKGLQRSSPITPKIADNLRLILVAAEVTGITKKRSWLHD